MKAGQRLMAAVPAQRRYLNLGVLKLAGLVRARASVRKFGVRKWRAIA